MLEKEKQKSLKNGWNILLKYLLEYKSGVVLLSVLGVISAIANGTIPYITGRFFDAILKPEIVFAGMRIEMPSWLFLIIIFALAQLVSDVVGWRNEIDRKKIGMKMYAIYIAKGWGWLLKLPKSFYAKEKIGSVVDRINKSAYSMESLIMNVVIDLAPQFLSLIVGFLIVFYISALLGFVLLAGVLFYIVVLIKVTPATVKIARKERDAWVTAWGDNYDAIMNVDTVKRFTSEKYEFKKILDRMLHKATKLSIDLVICQGNIAFYQKIIVSLTRILIFVISVSLISTSVISIGELIALNGYAMMSFAPFVQLGINWQKIQNGLVAVEEAEKILKTPAENYSPKNAVRINELKGDVEFRNVNFYYDKTEGEVLKDINLKIRAGEIIALVGESGVGKSTLVELISAYYFAQKGKILIDGVDIKKIDLTFLRKNIAVVPQEVSLFNDTIETNIKYGNFQASKDEIKKAVLDAHADEFINKFSKKYKQIVGERGIKLSVGQKQRVAIARAILRNPKILILDEPTSALDSVSEKYITESLKKLMCGRTTFIVAHRLSTVRSADRIVVFDQGRIVEIGAHHELMKIENGVYQKLYNLHVGQKA